MSWAWLVVRDDELRFVSSDEPEPEGAFRVDPRVHDAKGDPAWVSLVRAPRGVSIPFDDPAVSGALRDLLAGPPRRAVTTLLRDEVRFAGALLAADDGARLRPNSFARIFPARVFRVEAGVLGRRPWPTGPGIARYAGGAPWPWDRFGT
ncbi:MAG TPA: hypothetical protein VF101_14550 [Gaiellaceae bacterium]